MDNRVSTVDDQEATDSNDKVLRRVAEMKDILNAAEEYLDGDGEATDSESTVVTKNLRSDTETSSNFGKLKHSDFLLLLTQVIQQKEWELIWR